MIHKFKYKRELSHGLVTIANALSYTTETHEHRQSTNGVDMPLSFERKRSNRNMILDIKMTYNALTNQITE